MTWPVRIAWAFVLLLAGCHAARNVQSGQEPEPFDGMTLDLETMRVFTPSWSSELVDCSDESVQCLEAPGHFLVSMQRTCTRAMGWEAGGHSFRVIAQATHVGLPSGSYMSMKYPNVHWHFGPPVQPGFWRWARTEGTPMDRTWSPNETLEMYSVRTIGGDDWFRCS